MDNLTALANTGSGTDVLATDEIGGVHYPRTKVGYGVDGEFVDASAENALPVIDERTLNALERLIDNIGVLYPDIAGRLRVVLDTGSSIGTVTTVTTVTTVNTVNSVSNVAQIGGLQMNQLLATFQIGNEADLRRNIVIS